MSLRTSRFSHITPVLIKLHWLPVKFRIKFKLLLLTFKILHGLGPEYLTELIHVRPQTQYSLRSSSNGVFLSYPPICSRATTGDRAFQFAAPTLWNGLPHNVRCAGNVKSFKALLKTHLFSLFVH